MIELVRPDVAYEATFREAIGEALPDESSWAHEPERLTDFDGYVAWLHAQEQGRDLAPGHVRNSTRWLVDDGALVGRVHIRHELTEWLRSFGGHVGYYIRPSKRRLGYGRHALRLGLLEARALGLRRVLVTCDEDNAGSRRIIEHNGGLYENSMERTRRYWFDLPHASPACDVPAREPSL